MLAVLFKRHNCQSVTTLLYNIMISLQPNLFSYSNMEYVYFHFVISSSCYSEGPIK